MVIFKNKLKNPKITDNRTEPRFNSVKFEIVFQNFGYPKTDGSVRFRKTEITWLKYILVKSIN